MKEDKIVLLRKFETFELWAHHTQTGPPSRIHLNLASLRKAAEKRENMMRVGNPPHVGR